MAGDIWDLLGLGKPFVYGGAAYGLFHWLDAKASDEAKGTLTQLLKIKDYDSKRLADALVEVFDKLYTYPLLSWRAFLRSTVISIVLFAVCVFESFGFVAVIDGDFLLQILPFLAVNIVCDYCSLFFIRPWLSVCGRFPFIALLGGAVIGFTIVTIGFFLRTALEVLMDYDELSALYSLGNISEFGMIILTMLSLWVFHIPGVIVFVWLPLFALGIFVIRASNPIIAAVRKMQWFIKDGKEHPLEAVGYVAGAAVFITMGVLQHFL
jgi:hypothetical protein